VMLYLTGLILIPILSFLSILSFIKRKNYDATHSIIFYSIIFGLSSEILMRAGAMFFKNNTALYNIINLVEFIIFFYFYYRFISERIHKLFYLLILFIFISFYLFELADKGILVAFSYSFLLKNAILITFAILAFGKIVAYPVNALITNYSVFWINTGILIYYSCTFFIFGLRQYTLHLPTLTLVIVYLHLLFILVFYSFLSIGLWKTTKKYHQVNLIENDGKSNKER